MIFRIPREHVFPDPSLADPNGMLGVGGDLHPGRVLLAYQLGIFPWYSDGQPILWWSPDPRFVLRMSDFRVQRSLAKRIRQRPYRITMDAAFPDVLARCARAPRRGQEGTWITDAVRDSYVRLFDAGYAHSIEAWEGDALVGGLYGVSVGRLFAGESMFADRPDASKIAFVHAARQLERWGFPLIDCQVHTAHLERFGAREIPRATYLAELAELVQAEGRPGRWSFDADFRCDG
jgi:leucyl/phenylalanyl-tRNA--protein transferase